jgi:hypothetical protein
VKAFLYLELKYEKACISYLSKRNNEQRPMVGKSLAPSLLYFHLDIPFIPLDAGEAIHSFL